MDYSYELALMKQGYALVAGVDEAGRGPLAGPVFAAAVILPADFVLPGLNDSKKLTEQKREELFEQIVDQAIAFGVASCDEHIIDEINILQATMRAMEQAVLVLSPAPNYVVVDGNKTPRLAMACEALVKGDAKCASVAAASILAKVSRDRFLAALEEEYPGYGFARHKGYPTQAHYDAIRALGPCPAHRLTFLKKMH